MSQMVVSLTELLAKREFHANEAAEASARRAAAETLPRLLAQIRPELEAVALIEVLQLAAQYLAGRGYCAEDIADMAGFAARSARAV